MELSKFTGEGWRDYTFAPLQLAVVLLSVNELFRNAAGAGVSSRISKGSAHPFGAPHRNANRKNGALIGLRSKHAALILLTVPGAASSTNYVVWISTRDSQLGIRPRAGGSGS